MHQTVDVIVIGAGMAGLAAAATARAGGASVLVLDAHQGGGRARVTRKDGFTFNMGAHALYLGGAGADVLATLSIRPDGSPPPLRRYQLLREGRTGVMPSGPGSLARCSLLSFRSKAQLARVLTRLPRLDAAALAGTSMQGWLGSLDLRTDAEEVLAALVRIGTYCADLSALGADAGVAQLQIGVSKGVSYLHGGWGPLLAALAAGLRIETHRPVSAVRGDHRGVEVEAGGEVLLARTAVVAAGGPQVTGRLLGEVPAWGDLGGPLTAACLDVALRRPPQPGYVLGVDRPLYATVQGPGQAPPGMAVACGVRYGTTSPAGDRRDLEAHLATAGVDVGAAVHQRFMARMVVAETSCRPGPGGLRGRPAVTASGMDGVFIAGDWVGEDGLLAGAALASGHAAGRAALASVDGSGSRTTRLTT